MSTNISNLLEQLNLSSTVVVIDVESEEEEEEVTFVKDGCQHSIPKKHTIVSSMLLSSKIPNTSEKTDECVFCSMYGADECCLHNKNSGKGLRLTYRDAVESGMPLQYDGLVFKAVPSSDPSKFILKLEGKIVVVK